MARLQTTQRGPVLITRAAYLEEAMEDILTPCVNDVYAGKRTKLCSQLQDDLQCFDRPDTLIGRGLSGALFIPTLAMNAGLHWAIVRKRGDGSHSTEPIEGTIGERWLFVDDMISSGQTLEATCAVVQDHCTRHGHKSALVGAWTYAPRIVRLPRDLHLAQRLCDTVDENGDPVYADPKPYWGSLNGAIEELTKSLMGFPSVAREAGEYLKMASELPCVNDVYAGKRTKQRRVEAPKPYIPRGGKARRQLQALQYQTEARAFAMQQARDAFIDNLRRDRNA